MLASRIVQLHTLNNLWFNLCQEIKFVEWKHSFLLVVGTVVVNFHDGDNNCDVSMSKIQQFVNKTIIVSACNFVLMNNSWDLKQCFGKSDDVPKFVWNAKFLMRLPMHDFPGYLRWQRFP